jgi:hypothetical protein
MQPKPLEEIGEQLLTMELQRRERARESGVCDFCGHGPQTKQCRFPRRHHDPRIRTGLGL